MRKVSVMSCIFLLATSILMSIMTSPAQASIEQFTWLPPYLYRGGDDLFYQTDIIGYKEDTTALLQIPVYSDWWVGYPYFDYRPVNVSAVKVEFDWGMNYTSTEVSLDNPVQIQPYQTHTFTIDFAVPSTTVASNFVAHTYTIYVEHVNATTGPKKIVDTWEADWNRWYPAYKFAVFSADQSDAMDSYIECQAYYKAYPSYYFSNVEARLLAGQATVEASAGNLDYMRGDFAGAETQYQTALDLYSQAVAAEEAWGSTYQEAMLNVTKTEAEAAMTQANAALDEAEAAMKKAEAAYVWLFFGIGWVLIGIGVIVYALRKPKTPQ